MDLKTLEQTLASYRTAGFGDDAIVLARVDTSAPQPRYGGHPLVALNLFSTQDKLAESRRLAVADTEAVR